MTVRELITYLGFKVDDSGIKKYEKGIDGLKGRVGSLSKGLNSVGNLMRLVGSAVATAGIVSLGKSILDTTGEIEQYRVALGTMIGDQEKANRIIHDLDYSPVSDFYGTASAIGGLQGMVTFGMDAEKASDTLTRLGDIAQGNNDAFKSLSLNMGQVFAKGKADATDLKQFIGQGFDVVGEVSKMTGKSRAEIEKAGVTYEQVAMALEHITNEGGKYYGMLQKQSQTIPGMIKQFQSVFAAIKEGIGMSVSDSIKGLMADMLATIRKYQDKVVEIGSKIFNAILKGITSIIGWVEVLALRTNKFEGFRKLISSIVNLFKILGKEMIKIFVDFAPFIDKVAGVLANIINFLTKHIKLIEFLVVVIGSFVVAFKMVIGAIELFNTVMTIAKTIMLIFNAVCATNPLILIITAVIAGIILLTVAIIAIVKNWDKVKKAFAKFGEWVKSLFTKIKNIVIGIWNAIKSFFIAYVKTIFNLWKGVFDAIKFIWMALVTFYQNLWEKIKSIFFSFVDWVKLLFTDPVEAIKQLWNGLINFYQNLWSNITGVFSNAIEGIKSKFTGLWDGIKDIASKIGGFFGIDVNSSNSTSDSAMKNNAGVSNSYASTINNNSVRSPVVNSSSNITVNVPKATSEEQAKEISRQVQKAVNDSWSSAINGGRSTIPSPEARSF